MELLHVLNLLSRRKLTHYYGYFVSFTLKNLCGDRRETQVTTSEVHDLKPSRLKPRDFKHDLEMLVEHI